MEHNRIINDYIDKRCAPVTKNYPAFDYWLTLCVQQNGALDLNKGCRFFAYQREMFLNAVCLES